jgi:DNA-directed RNA polymerase specialized sigma24 family protein
MGNSLKEVLGWSGSQCLAFRKELKGHGYLQKSLKFWAYAALVKRSRPKSAAPVHRSDFDVKKADALWLKALIESGVPASRALCRFVRKYRVEYTPVTTAEFDKQAEAVLSELFVTCRKFVHRKFRFLTQSGQLEGSNIVSELMESALRAMYRAYPVIESPLHMKNIGIRTIHNVGINIIKEQTTQSRQRVVKNAAKNERLSANSNRKLLLNQEVIQRGIFTERRFANQANRIYRMSMLKLATLWSGSILLNCELTV